MEILSEIWPTAEGFEIFPALLKAVPDVSHTFGIDTATFLSPARGPRASQNNIDPPAHSAKMKRNREGLGNVHVRV
jgi:hypothetical protein